MTFRSFKNELMFYCWVIKNLKWKVECQAKVRNLMSCATQCPTTLLYYHLKKFKIRNPKRITEIKVII